MFLTVTLRVCKHLCCGEHMFHCTASSPPIVNHILSKTLHNLAESHTGRRFTFTLAASNASVPAGGSPGKNLASGAAGSWFGGNPLYHAVLAATCIDNESARSRGRTDKVCALGRVQNTSS